MAGLVDDVRTVYADGLPGPVARVLRSGDGQLGLPDTRLPFDIMLVLQDRFGNAVGGVDVDWSVSAGDGSIDPAQLASDGHGAARTAWTLGPSLGAQALDGDVVGLGRFRFVSTAVGSAAESGAWSPPTLASPLPVR
jgi:hypothetical protein